MIYKITPNPKCKVCHGSGSEANNVPWGSTYATEWLLCDCISEQLPEEFDDAKDEIEVVPLSSEPEWEFDRWWED